MMVDRMSTPKPVISITDVDAVICMELKTGSSNSVVGSPEELSNDEYEPQRSNQRRKDSGYSEDLRRPIYKSTPDDARFDFLELQANLIEVARAKEMSDNYATHGSKRKGRRSSQRRPSRQLSAQPSEGAVYTATKQTKPPSRTLSSNLPSPKSSTYGNSEALTRTTSMDYPNSVDESSLVTQKARDTTQALKASGISLSSTETNQTPSFKTSRSLEQFFEDPSYGTSAMTSTTLLESPQRAQTSPLYTATNIDWTDPTTRRAAYEKHDRNSRGVRRLFQKLTPRRWQTERLDFYDGNSDAGSVRRYRLDIEDMEEAKPATAERAAHPGLDRARHTLACLPLLRGTSKGSEHE